MGRALLLLLVLMASPALAQKSPHKEGEYGGVTPGQTSRADPAGKPKKPRRAPPPGTLTWVGFEAKDGGATVFLQSVAPFEVTGQRVEGATLILDLSLTRLGGQSWRRMDTRFFDTPISGIIAKARGARRATKGASARGRSVELRITFKNPIDAHEGAVRAETDSDGMAYVFVSFPPGAAPATN